MVRRGRRVAQCSIRSHLEQEFRFGVHRGLFLHDFLTNKVLHSNIILTLRLPVPLLPPVTLHPFLSTKCLLPPSPPPLSSLPDITSGLNGRGNLRTILSMPWPRPSRVIQDLIFLRAFSSKATFICPRVPLIPLSSPTI